MPDYRHVSVADLPEQPSATDHRKAIADALGASAFALNYFVARPGQRIPLGGYHAHGEQEECFYVLEGSVVFDTEAGEVPVDAGEVFFAPPEHPHRGRAVGDEPARVLAIGAPADAGGATVMETCPACGGTTDRNFAVTDEADDRTVVLACAACGAETDRFSPGPDGD